jgi:putative transposase
MLIFEFKVKAKSIQYGAIDEAIRTAQFIRNKCLRFWIDNEKVSKYDLNKYSAVLANEFSFADKLNSMARQSSAERAWSAISRFYDNCKKSRQVISGGSFPQKNPAVAGLKGYPKFQKNNRSVEYKTTGWKLAENRKSITMTDKNGIGKLKLCGTRDLNFYQPEQIKRVRLVRRADGYYCQFAISVERTEVLSATGNTLGLDVGLESFCTNSNGQKIQNPRFYRLGEVKMKRAQKLVSRKIKGSSNRNKARTKLGRVHLKISRQRQDHAIKLARCVVQSNDLIAYEDLRSKNLVKNHNLAKSINDAGWYQFRLWLEYFGKVFGRITIAVNPAYTSAECSDCGVIVKKSLSTRTHVCQCGCVLDRDENAALNILTKAIGTTGHVGTLELDSINASGETTTTLVDESLLEQVVS